MSFASRTPVGWLPPCREWPGQAVAPASHRLAPPLLLLLSSPASRPKQSVRGILRPGPRQFLPRRGGPRAPLAAAGAHNRICPVDRALAIHRRSRALKGTSTKLTLAGRFLALSGYMKWCVVRLPTSCSKPTVGA